MDPKNEQLDITFQLSCKWLPVMSNETEIYTFPDKITPFMKLHYRIPAIYRWHIYKSKPGDLKQIYIGEAVQLCPQRLNGYLRPGPSQQTNIRINKMFNELINDGRHIQLEYLDFDVVKIEDIEIISENLIDKHVRRMLEEVMVIYSTHKGYTILNK